MSTGLIWQTMSTNSADTTRLGELVGNKCKGGEVIELRADLGGGKTTFTQGLAKGLGGTDNVVSPTFTLKRIYKAGELELYHYDFYRLDDPGILADELAESINNTRAVTVIEWSGIVNDVLPAEHIAVEFNPTANDPDEREITIIYPESFEGAMREIETEWAGSQP